VGAPKDGNKRRKRKMDLTEARLQCGEWNEDLEWCDDDFPESCPFHEECKKEAEEEE